MQLLRYSRSELPKRHPTDLLLPRLPEFADLAHMPSAVSYQSPAAAAGREKDQDTTQILVARHLFASLSSQFYFFGRMDGWADGWMDIWMGGWMDG